MPTTGKNTLLLDIYQRLGTVEAQNSLILVEQGRARSDTTAIVQDMAEVAKDLAESKVRIALLEPSVAKMVGFKAQVGIVVVFVVAVVSGAINLLYYAITHLSEIKTALRGLLN